jgi:hypothetical protein
MIGVDRLEVEIPQNGDHLQYQRKVWRRCFGGRIRVHPAAPHKRGELDGGFRFPPVLLACIPVPDCRLYLFLRMLSPDKSADAISAIWERLICQHRYR